MSLSGSRNRLPPELKKYELDQPWKLNQREAKRRRKAAAESMHHQSRVGSLESCSFHTDDRVGAEEMKAIMAEDLENVQLVEH
jgi:hypothetical protein